MFTRKPDAEASPLDEAITAAVKQLDYVPAYSDEYAAIVNQITALTALKNATDSSRIKPEVWLPVAGNLLGILIIVGYEQKNVMTSKAVSFVQKAIR